MRPTDLFRNTSFRFAAFLTTAFLAAYLIAGVAAYITLKEEFDERIVQNVDLSAAVLVGQFEKGGRVALIESVIARTKSTESDDEIIWLGDTGNQRLAGQNLAPPANLKTGDFFGSVVGAMETDDLYRIVVRDIGGMRLILGFNYDESDDISDALISAFGWATIFIILFATIAGFALAKRAQKRLDQIKYTLNQVSTGAMKSRVPLSGAGDDLDQLSDGINDALDRLEQTVEAIRQVSTDIAHDLRTPINRLGIILESARSNIGGKDRVEKKLEQATDEIKHITRTFDALLRIAQIEAGAGKARFQEIDIANIAAALFEAYQPVAEEMQRRLELHPIPEQKAMVFGDKDLLTQLFANLVENAIRHCPESSTISIVLKSDAAGASICVSDNGPGIPEKEHDNALKRFYRLEKSRTSHGFGLGLALVKAICDLHNGKLTLTDNKPGLNVCVKFPPLRDAPLPRSASSEAGMTESDR